LGIAAARLAGEGQQTKMELVYAAEREARQIDEKLFLENVLPATHRGPGPQPDDDDEPASGRARLAPRRSRPGTALALWSEQAVGIIGGEPKCCKSFLALDLAVAVAAGDKIETENQVLPAVTPGLQPGVASCG
jgi:AAA domain